MSLYADYIKEREGSCSIETEKGFVIYQIDGDECYISDLYVIPDSRLGGVGRELLREVLNRAENLKCKYILGVISVRSKTSSGTLIAMLRLGARVLRADEDLVYLTYPIE